MAVELCLLLNFMLIPYIFCLSPEGENIYHPLAGKNFFYLSRSSGKKFLKILKFINAEKTGASL